MDHTATLRLGMMAVAAMASALVSLVPAWACVPGAALPFVMVKPAPFAPAGSQLTVEGLHFLPAPIEVRWNGVEGPLLQGATGANGPDFSVTATVPDQPAGLYALVVLSRRPDGSIADTAQVAFQVTSSDEGGKAPTPGPLRPSTSGRATPEESSLGDELVWLVVAGAVLVGLGGVGGVMVSRQRKRQAS